MNASTGSSFGSFTNSANPPLPNGPPVSNPTPSQPNQNDGVSKMFKLAARACGTIAGILSLALGLFACITLTARCLAAGLIQMLLGFIIVTFEAPCCCMFLDFIERISHFSETRPYWQKALFYCLLSIIPIAMCIEVSTFFGAGIIFITGILYGMMALGKKADRTEMMARAAATNPAGSTGAGTGGGGGFFNMGFGTGASRDTMDVNLVDREKQPTVLSA